MYLVAGVSNTIQKSRSDMRGKTTSYRCDGCGLKEESPPMPPAPAPAVYPLPRGWTLGIVDDASDSPALCEQCKVGERTEESFLVGCS